VASNLCPTDLEANGRVNIHLGLTPYDIGCVYLVLRCEMTDEEVIMKFNHRSKQIALLLLLLSLIGLPIGCAEQATDQQKSLLVHFINVGQGDSILVESARRFMLVDAGDASKADTVLNYLRNRGVKELDVVVATHPHSDHIGGMAAVIRAFPVETIIMPQVAHTSSTYERLLTTIAERDMRIATPQPGKEFSLGDATVKVLGPNGSTYSSLNNYSVVVKIELGSTSFLLTGDAEALAEQEMIDRGLDLQATVLKVGHHGSSSSTSDTFLSQASPKYAVISLGADNEYGHPHQEIMEKLQAAAIPVYRTDLCGTIVAVTDGQGINFSSELGCSGSGADPASRVAIDSVDLRAEVVIIANSGTETVDLSGWRLVSVKGEQVFHFPPGTILAAGATVQIVSGKDAAAGAGVLVWTKNDIWNNSGDPAELYDANQRLISRK
jgi:competence protein ComEC